jgi:hypothetical protein
VTASVTVTVSAASSAPYPVGLSDATIQVGGVTRDYRVHVPVGVTSTPRASGKQADELLREVYGGSQATFRALSPRRHATENAAVISRESLVRLVIGSRDETFQNNLAFHEHLVALGIPHDWIVIEGVGHSPMATLEALGDSHWDFYRRAFD